MSRVAWQSLPGTYQIDLIDMFCSERADIYEVLTAGCYSRYALKVETGWPRTLKWISIRFGTEADLLLFKIAHPDLHERDYELC